MIHPYLTGDELVGSVEGCLNRYIIDLSTCGDILSAKRHGAAYARVEQAVLPDIKAKAEAEHQLTGSKTGPRQSHYQRWWRLWRGRSEMIEAVERFPRYVGCARVTKRPIFEFIHSKVRPSDVVQVFAFPDDYSFGILQSGLHWAWFTTRCSTLKGDFRYTSETVFDTFPWPQAPTPEQAWAVAAAALALRTLRRQVMADNGWSLRDLYRTLDLPGKNPLRGAHEQLDAAVRGAYGMKAKDDPLAFLLALNKSVAEREAAGQPVTAPGLPPGVSDPSPYITQDCITPP